MLVNWNVSRDNKLGKYLQAPNILAQNQKYWFFRHWPDVKVEVDVIDYSQFPLVHSIEKNLLRFYCVQALKALPLIPRYDVIISHGAQSGIFLAFLRSVLGIDQPPHVIIDVGCLNGGRSRQPELLLFQFAMRSVSGIIYHATPQRKHYKRYFPSLAKKAFFVPFGVDTEFFAPVEVKPGDYILSIGYKLRDWKALLEAFRNIQTDIELKIVGPEKNDLKVGDLPSNVSYLPYVPVTVLKDLIARAGFIVVPLMDIPYAHGQMTLLQSMAMGKAVIVTKVAATSEYVSDGYDGLFVKPNDAYDMKEKISFLLGNPAEIEKLGKNARRSTEQKFNERNMAAGIFSALIQLSVF